jgi:hypothetical protein
LVSLHDRRYGGLARADRDLFSGTLTYRVVGTVLRACKELPPLIATQSHRRGLLVPGTAEQDGISIFRNLDTCATLAPFVSIPKKLTI